MTPAGGAVFSVLANTVPSFCFSLQLRFIFAAIVICRFLVLYLLYKEGA